MKRKSLFKVLALFLFLISFSLFFVSCTSGGHNPTPNPLYSYDELRQGVYRGGYMIHSEKPEINQVVNGMAIPLRLQVIPPPARKIQDEDYIAEIFYGYMTIDNIVENPGLGGKIIQFSYLFYDDEGQVSHFGHDISLNSAIEGKNGVDFNNDGFQDVFFHPYNLVEDALRSNRRCIDASDFFLKFSDPREKGNSCSYRILTQMYEANEYPSGILGINPDGNYIATSKNFEIYNEITPTATQVGFYSPSIPYLRTGDFIIDIQNERFREIVNVIEQTDDYILFESTDTTIDKAFVIFDLEYSQPVQVSINRALLNEREHWQHSFDEVLWQKTVDTPHGEFDQSLEASGDVDIQVNLSASYHAGVHWKWHVVPILELSCDVGIKFDFDHHFYLDYKAVEAFEKEWTKQLFDAQVKIDVEGVPITLSADGKLGLDITGNAEADFYTGYRFKADLDAGIGYKLGDGFNHHFHHSIDFSKYGPELAVKGTLDIKPYFELDVGLTVAYIATVESNTKPYVEGTCNGNAGVFMDQDYHVKAEDMFIDLDLYGGLEQDITLKLGYKSISVHKTFTLYDHKWKIWEVDFKWPRALENFRMNPQYQQTVFEWDDKSNVETGFKIYDNPQQRDDYQLVGTVSKNQQAFTFEKNLDATFIAKAYYHVQAINKDLYQLADSQVLQLIACPEVLKGQPLNGILKLLWFDVSNINTTTQIYAKQAGAADYQLIKEVDGDATEYDVGDVYDWMDASFKARAVYEDDHGTPHYSAFSNVFDWHLPTPSDFKGSVKEGDTLLDLSWNDDSTLNNKTEIYLKRMSDADFGLFATLDGQTASLENISYTNAGPGSAFKLRAVYENGGKTFYSPFSDVYQWPLSAPSNLSGKLTYRLENYVKYLLKWENNSNIYTYIQIWYDPSRQRSPQTLLVDGNTTEKELEFYIHTALFQPDFSYFKVRGVFEDSSGNRHYSDYSNEVKEYWSPW